MYKKIRPIRKTLSLVFQYSSMLTNISNTFYVIKKSKYEYLKKIKLKEVNVSSVNSNQQSIFSNVETAGMRTWVIFSVNVMIS